MKITGNCLIIVPHQDDEILGCCTLIKRNPEAIFDICVVIRGSGPCEKFPYLNNDIIILDKVRELESRTACAHFPHVDFLEWPHCPWIIRNTVGQHLGYKALFNGTARFKDKFFEYDYIFTVNPKDKHDEHQALGKVILEITKEHPHVYTFYVDKSRDKPTPDEYRLDLSKEELEFKKNLCDVFQTQSHFLPNIVRREEYWYERFYKEK